MVLVVREFVRTRDLLYRDPPICDLLNTYTQKICSAVMHIQIHTGVYITLTLPYTDKKQPRVIF